MFEAGTPVTIGILAVGVAGFCASTYVLVWLYKQFRALKNEIVSLIEKSEAAAERRIAAASSQLAVAEGRVALLNEKQHAVELRIAELRAEVAETYMTKASAGLAIERLTTQLVGLRSDIDGRFNSIENHLRGGNAAAG